MSRRSGRDSDGGKKNFAVVPSGLERSRADWSGLEYT